VDREPSDETVDEIGDLDTDTRVDPIEEIVDPVNDESVAAADYDNQLVAGLYNGQIIDRDIDAYKVDRYDYERELYQDQGSGFERR
jgi:hypothetical protein